MAGKANSGGAQLPASSNLVAGTNKIPNAPNIGSKDTNANGSIKGMGLPVGMSFPNYYGQHMNAPSENPVYLMNPENQVNLGNSGNDIKNSWANTGNKTSNSSMPMTTPNSSVSDKEIMNASSSFRPKPQVPTSSGIMGISPSMATNSKRKPTGFRPPKKTVKQPAVAQPGTGQMPNFMGVIRGGNTSGIRVPVGQPVIKSSSNSQPSATNLSTPGGGSIVANTTPTPGGRAAALSKKFASMNNNNGNLPMASSLSSNSNFNNTRRPPGLNSLPNPNISVAGGNVAPVPSAQGPVSSVISQQQTQHNFSAGNRNPLSNSARQSPIDNSKNSGPSPTPGGAMGSQKQQPQHPQQPNRGPIQPQIVSSQPNVFGNMNVNLNMNTHGNRMGGSTLPLGMNSTPGQGPGSTPSQNLNRNHLNQVSSMGTSVSGLQQGPSKTNSLSQQQTNSNGRPSLPPRAGMRELKVEDALIYLDQVKQEFGKQPRIYNEFLEIMKNFKAHEIDTPGVIRRVSQLFRGYDNLILGFNTFLPDGFQIERKDLMAGGSLADNSLDPQLAHQRHQDAQLQQNTSNANPNLGAPIPGQNSSLETSQRQKQPQIQKEYQHHNNPAVNTPSESPIGRPANLQQHTQGPNTSNSTNMGINSKVMQPNNKYQGHVTPAGMNTTSVVGSTPSNTPNAMGKQGISMLGGSKSLTVPPHSTLTSHFQPKETPPFQKTQQHSKQDQQLQQTSHRPPQAITQPNPQQESQQSTHISQENSKFTSTQTTQQQAQPHTAQGGIEFDHAITYVTTIKKRFVNEPKTYQQFLEILHTYQKEQRGIREVLEQVSRLFADHPDLLKEFTHFLPEAVQEQAKERLHRAAADAEKRIASAAKKEQEQKVQAAQATQAAQAAQAQIPLPNQDHMQPNSSVYGATGPPSSGTSFGIPQPPQRSISSSSGSLPPVGISVNNVTGNLASNIPNVTAASNPKLKDDSNNSSVPGKIHTSFIGGSLPHSQQKLIDMTKQQNSTTMICEVPTLSSSSPTTGRKRPHSSVTAASVSSTHNKKHAGLSYQYPPQPKTFVYNSGVERQFFDNVKEALNSFSRDELAWNEFLKAMEMYTQETLSRDDLMKYTQELLKQNPDLFEEFKHIVNAAGAPNSSTHDDSWHSVPLSEIDFGRCRKCSPSYRALPRDYPNPPCSERNEVESSVLNDVWVSLPVGSEESYTFRHMRKNQNEEVLFRCEDERFEIDMVIDSNAATLRRLEPIAEEIDILQKKELRSLSQSQNGVSTKYKSKRRGGMGAKIFQYSFDERVLNTIHRHCISRLYGDAGNEMLRLISKNPTVAIPIVVKRLRQKDEEFRAAREAISPRWKDLAEQNYYKSLDHRSLTWRTTDKRATSTRTLASEIKDRALHDGNESESALTVRKEKSKEEHGSFYEITMGRYLARKMDLKGLPTPTKFLFTPHLSICYDNSSWAQMDAYRILSFAVERGSTSPGDKEKCHRLWRDFLGPFFSLSTMWMQKPTKSFAGSLLQNSASSGASGVFPMSNGDESSNDDEESSSDENEMIGNNSVSDDIMNYDDTGSTLIDQQPISKGETVLTNFGEGILLRYRHEDETYIVSLSYGKAYLRPNMVLSTMQSVEKSALTTELMATFKETLDRNDDMLMIGPQSLYLFFRLHQILIKRLGIARKLAFSVGNDKSLITLVEKMHSGKGQDVGMRRYNAFLSLVYNLIEGGYSSSSQGASSKATEGGKYEDRLRSLLGHGAYELATMDKLVSHILKNLQNMANDDSLSNLIQLFRRHKESGCFRPIAFRQEAKYLTEGDMFAFQYCKVPNSNEALMHMEFLGCIAESDDEDDSIEQDSDSKLCEMQS
mmetsp:Transcript_13663/g.19538  ORF Transcript_13663/g.19538 Transcript_13663/m.19538 type:complete len:1843 (+) Transcript_13663:250-5778(+)